MKLTRPSDVRALLAEMDFRPSRRLGQNFLVDANILRIMIETSAVSAQDIVIEIGPGLGALTGPLLERASRVIAIEADERLFDHLLNNLGGAGNLSLLHADAARADLPSMVREGANKVVSNLPYSAGSRILMNLFEAHDRPESIVVTVQDEVADRLAAQPDTPDYGLLSVWAQVRYTVRIAKRVSPGCFMPAPQVSSAIVALARRDAVPELPRCFKAVVKRAFEQRRKKLANSLGLDEATADRLRKAGLDTGARPESVPPDGWIRLAREMER